MRTRPSNAALGLSLMLQHFLQMRLLTDRSTLSMSCRVKG